MSWTARWLRVLRTVKRRDWPWIHWPGSLDPGTPAAAEARMQDASEARPEATAHGRVDERVHAGVEEGEQVDAQHGEEVVLLLQVVAAELGHHGHQKVRRPGEGERRSHNHHHLGHLPEKRINTGVKFTVCNEFSSLFQEEDVDMHRP